MAFKPRTVEEIFKDYSTRRSAIIRAHSWYYSSLFNSSLDFHPLLLQVLHFRAFFFSDVDKLYKLCDPGKDNLCLYGYPNKAWEVTLPSEEVPPELPEPTIGINFARDDVSYKHWISLVAVHSDSWLLSVAFYLGIHLNHIKRKRLFGLINTLPTIFQVVTDNKHIKNKSTKVVAVKNLHFQIVCGSCSGNYNKDEFWISCDICGWWYHGRCIMMNPREAETIKHYKCASCSLRNGML